MTTPRSWPDGQPEPGDSDTSTDGVGGTSADPIPGTQNDASAEPIPQLYIACPLTGLDADEQRLEATSLRVENVKRAVEESTIGNRTDAEQWPIRLHVPFDHSRPGADGGLSPGTIYNRNLDALLSSDGLIVVTDEYCSAGIGQEIEWAVRSGIPILYLSRVRASRQLLGTPHNLDARQNGDAETAAAHVRQWLRTHKAQIHSGPNRRADRELAYLDLMARLAVAWRKVENPTAVAAQMHLPPVAIDSIVQSPARVALTPWWTVCELAALLGVSLDARRSLTLRESRAWVMAAEGGGWDERIAERIRALAVTSGATDLEIPAVWTDLFTRVVGDSPDSSA